MSEGAQRQKPQRCVRGGPVSGIVVDRARLRAAAGFLLLLQGLQPPPAAAARFSPISSWRHGGARLSL